MLPAGYISRTVGLQSRDQEHKANQRPDGGARQTPSISTRQSLRPLGGYLNAVIDDRVAYLARPAARMIRVRRPAPSVVQRPAAAGPGWPDDEEIAGIFLPLPSRPRARRTIEQAVEFPFETPSTWHSGQCPVIMEEHPVQARRSGAAAHRPPVRRPAGMYQLWPEPPGERPTAVCPGDIGLPEAPNSAEHCKASLRRCANVLLGEPGDFQLHAGAAGGTWPQSLSECAWRQLRNGTGRGDPAIARPSRSRRSPGSCWRGPRSSHFHRSISSLSRKAPCQSTCCSGLACGQ